MRNIRIPQVFTLIPDFIEEGNNNKTKCFLNVTFEYYILSYTSPVYCRSSRKTYK